MGACPSPLLPDQHAIEPSAESFGFFPEGIPCDPHRFRRLFPDLWSGFLRAHFRDHLQAAYELGVSEKTGRDWWEGVTGANGASAIYAVATIPGAMQHIVNAMKEAA